MLIDWVQLARDVGSIHEGGESGGTAYASAALETILGEDNLHAAVEAAMSLRRGSELAMNVLRMIGSERAARIAYDKYKAGHENADRAVWLIKHIAHPCAVAWIAEFLDDAKVAGWGVGVLDQLLYDGVVDTADVEPLLVRAEAHANDNVREQAAFIRGYLSRRANG